MRSSIFQSLDERCALKLNAQLKTNFLAKLSQSAPSAVQIDLSDSFHYKCQTGQTSFATRRKLWVWFKYKVNSSLFIILIGLGDTGFRMFGQINERKLNEQWTSYLDQMNACPPLWSSWCLARWPPWEGSPRRGGRSRRRPPRCSCPPPGSTAELAPSQMTLEGVCYICFKTF